jgi:hypothetical protein
MGRARAGAQGLRQADGNGAQILGA